MPRRIFISFQHDDRMKAKGFNLLRWNKNVDIEFVGRHLLDPVDSTNDAYITERVREQLNGTSVTIVLLGEKTYDSDWVKKEIDISLGKDKPNGVLAIRLTTDPPLSADSPVGTALRECGAEIIDWNPHQFADAIERAATAAGRAQAIQSGAGSIRGGCGR